MGAVVLHFRLLSYLVCLISFLIWPVLNLFNTKKRTLIPRTNNPVFSCSASTLAHKIRMRYITCEELVSLFIERLKVVNPIINGIVEERYADALAEAKECDRVISNYTIEELELKKPLFGVPITIKESTSLKGFSLEGGCPKRLGIKAEKDGICVARLRAAGAIPLCVTSTPEYCLSIECYNKIQGSTNCPYNTLYTSGGSSGGEGAVIGAGASVCGLGSDIAGSIRIPAAFNGIFGHKFSPYLVPLEDHFPYTDNYYVNYLMTIGPLVRYSEDLPLLTKVLTAEKAKLLNLDEPVSIRSLNIFFMEDCGNEFGILKVQEEIKTAIRNAVQHMGNTYGAQISGKKFKQLEIAPEFGVATLVASGFPDPCDDITLPTELLKYVCGKSHVAYNMLVYLLFKRYSFLFTGDVSKYKSDIEDLKKEVISELGTNGVFIFPSFPTSALPHKGCLYGTIGFVYLMVANTLGLPSTHVPVGVDHKGLPIGIQVMAAPNQDRLCFAVAAELESYFGGWKAPY